MSVEVVLCRLSAHRVAVGLARVREVTSLAATVPVPGAAPWVLGLLDLRGELVPVVDVEGHVARAEREPELSELVVICDVDGRGVGLVVRDVLGVAELTDAGPKRVDGEGWVAGVLRDRDGPVLLLDVTALERDLAHGRAA